jgi:hypothetical protein
MTVTPIARTAPVVYFKVARIDKKRAADGAPKTRSKAARRGEDEAEAVARSAFATSSPAVQEALAKLKPGG